MADIRCPMCGRPNPEELDECIFCQARLRPLVAPQPPFNAVEPASAVPPPAPEEPPDWLAKIREQKPAEEPAVDPFENLTPELSSSDEVPDWLRSVRELTQKDGLNKEHPLGVPDLGVEPGSAEVDPDWLESLRDVKVPDEESVPTEDQAAPIDQVPDWLIYSPQSNTRPENEPGTDWLNGLRDLEEKPLSTSDAEPLEAASPVHPEEGLDWVRDMRGPVPLEPENELPAAAAPLAPVEPPVVVPPVVPLQARKSKSRPARQSPPPVEPTPAPEPGQPVPPAEPQGAQWEPGWSPEWLSSIEGKAADTPDQNQQPSPDQPVEGDLPDWLSELGTARSARPVREERESSGEEEWIAPAELPNWVQEMRPVETVAPELPPESVRKERVEERGPLAGLKNVLPSEPSATEIRRPPVYIPRLQVSERHQAHSELLTQLIASESEPVTAAQQPAISTQRILRLVLAVVLLAAVLYPIISGSAIFPVPSSVPQEITWAYETIDSLGQNDTVLVAVDYEAGFTGEMEAAGSAVIDHLMSKGTRLALISTNPVGQALAERLMSSATSRSEPYMTPYLNGDQVVNLGYLPGGTAGLASLVADPRQAAYFDVLGRPAWDLPALSGVASITGFSEILVLTENVDTARAWFEQVGIALPANSSVVLVTSAQAAPILRAYLDSGQAQGMVSGLTGGTAYEHLRNQPGAARSIWDAYQMGTWAAVLLILGGALVSILWPMLQQRTRKTFTKEASL